MSNHIMLYSFSASFAKINMAVHGKFLKCAVLENIATLATEGIGISWRMRGYVRPKKFNEMFEAQLEFPEGWGS